MANKVNKSAPLPSPFNLNSFQGIADFITQLVNSLRSELSDHAQRLNSAVVTDGTEGPQIFRSFVKAALPSAAIYTNGIIIVSDDVGGLTPAFSDGTVWRRTSDRAVIS